MLPSPATQGTVGNLVEYTVKRGFGDGDSDIPPVYTDEQQYALQVLAVTFSSVSVASAILAFYWFRRMRRSFRHDLIMFLIQSDMFKALWLMIHPIIIFTTGPVPSSSMFCQVSGFFVALGVEASDFAVLMIAIHTALYVFKPGTAPGQGGLYPYRHKAFIAWFIFPLLMASLAFVNNINGYTSQETYCYLPVRPFWYSLALSWIPRYIIFIVILGVYVSLYVYVKYKFQNFSKQNEEPAGQSQDTMAGEEREGGGSKILKTHSLPITPPLAYHGLIPASRNSSFLALSAKRQSSNLTEYRASELSRSSTQTASAPRAAQALAALRRNETYMSDYSSPEMFSEFSRADRESCPNVQVGSAPAISTPNSHPTTSGTSWTTFMARFTSPRSNSPRSTVGILKFLRVQPHHPASPSIASTPMAHLRLVNSRGQDLETSEMVKTRYRIRRQLRFLFIYPLVYIGMWVLPFVSHALQYNDKYALDPPFALTAIGTVIINSQCAVDCWLFCTREKPWRHISGSKGGFLESFVVWKGGLGRRHHQKRGPGKTEAELSAEAEMAYQRRDEEMAARQLEVESLHSNISPSSRACRERSWWDEPERLDGTMNSVPEEAVEGVRRPSNQGQV